MKRKEIGKWVLLALLGIGIFQIVLPQQELSTAERRRLIKRPELSFESIKDGSYGETLEAGLLDQFPGRELFRGIYAFTQQKILGKWDVADYYVVDGNISKLDPVLEEKNVIRAATQFSDICKNYFPEADCYYAVIPDKNYFLAEKNGYPALDYHRLSALMKEYFTEGSGIAIGDLLELSDYYRTDLHWRQYRQPLSCLQSILTASGGQCYEADGLRIYRQIQGVCAAVCRIYSGKSCTAG